MNAFFDEKQWSDGLPIVPPAMERVEQFLKYTDRPPDDVLGVLAPANRQATVWNVAVNGVMAGCRPEYIPVLIAMVEQELMMVNTFSYGNTSIYAETLDGKFSSERIPPGGSSYHWHSYFSVRSTALRRKQAETGCHLSNSEWGGNQ